MISAFGSDLYVSAQEVINQPLLISHEIIRKQLLENATLFAPQRTVEIRNLPKNNLEQLTLYFTVPLMLSMVEFWIR